MPRRDKRSICLLLVSLSAGTWVFTLCIWVFCLRVCLCTMCVQCQRVSDSLELELTHIYKLLCGCWGSNLGLLDQFQCSNHWVISPALPPPLPPLLPFPLLFLLLLFFPFCSFLYFITLWVWMLCLLIWCPWEARRENEIPRKGVEGIWGLRLKPKSFGRTSSALKHSAISPACCLKLDM